MSHLSTELSPNLEIEGVDLTFTGLTYSVKIPPPPSIKNLVPGLSKTQAATEKVILKSLDGHFRTGRVSAILGPSGGGKTSLLSLIAGHNLGGKVTGDICVNQKKTSLKHLRAVAGFVHQEDVILPTMTVEEALRMALSLRTEKITTEVYERRLNRILDTLSLSHTRNTFIGSSMLKGISGGEKKRVAIGMELMANPPVLLLDECTSGLDSYSAYSVMCTLRKIASRGTTVVATLHQPSSEIFELIDDLIILVKGEIIYRGEASKMVDYFAGLSYKCPAYNNPPDFVFMKVINNNSPENVAALVERVKEQSQDNLESNPFGGPGNKQVSFKFFPSFWQQLLIISKRSSKNLIRNPMIIRARLAQMVIIALLIGGLYYNIVSRGSLQDLQHNIGGAIFFLSTNLFMGGAISNMSVFSEERSVFMREYTSGYYRVLAYFLAKVFVELPINIILPIIFCTISYWMVGYSYLFNEYVIYCCAGILCNITGTAWGLLIASLFSNLTVALAVLPVTILPLMLMGGLLASNEVAPGWIQWMQWISPVQYTYTALMHNFLNDFEYKNPDGSITSGSAILKQLGVNDTKVYLNFIYIAIIYFVAHLVAYCGLQRLANISGGSPYLSNSKKLKLSGGSTI